MPGERVKLLQQGRVFLTVITLPVHLSEYFVSLEEPWFTRGTDLSRKTFQPLYPVAQNEEQQLVSISSEPWKSNQLFPFSTLSPLSYQAVWAPLACWCWGGRLAALSPPPSALGTSVYTCEQKREMPCSRDKSAQMEIMASYYLKKNKPQTLIEW